MTTFGDYEQSKTWRLLGDNGERMCFYGYLDESQVRSILDLSCLHTGETLENTFVYQLDSPEIGLPEGCGVPNDAYVRIEYVQQYVDVILTYTGPEIANVRGLF